MSGRRSGSTPTCRFYRSAPDRTFNTGTSKCGKLRASGVLPPLWHVATQSEPSAPLYRTLSRLLYFPPQLGVTHEAALSVCTPANMRCVCPGPAVWPATRDNAPPRLWLGLVGPCSVLGARRSVASLPDRRGRRLLLVLSRHERRCHHDAMFATTTERIHCGAKPAIAVPNSGIPASRARACDLACGAERAIPQRI